MYYKNYSQGFKNFHGTVHRHDEIHVYLDSSWPRMWRARGMHGDYGIFKTKCEAIMCAIDAKISSLYDSKIYVHKGFQDQPFVITKIKNIKPSSQFFQDVEWDE